MNTPNQKPPYHPTIKKAAIRQDEPLSEKMNYTTSIEPESQNPLDNHEGRSASSHREVTAFGATVMIEPLKDSQRTSYVKPLVNMHAVLPKTEQFVRANKDDRRGRLTAESNPFTPSKTGIDQVTFTFVNPYYGTYASWLKNYFKGDAVHTGSGQFYKDKYTHKEAGFSILTGHNISGGSKVEFDASGWNQLTFEQQIKLIKDAYNMGGRVSRIDLFHDTFGDDITIVEEAILKAAAPASTPLLTDPRIPKVKGKNLGKTLYLGSRKSKRYWRIYDKGAEQNTTCNTWQRVEVEVKQDYADQIGKLITNTTTGLCAETIRNLIFLDEVWNDPPQWWTELRTAAVELATNKEQINLERWIRYLGKQFFPRFRTIANKLQMPIEQVFMHANALDHDDIVSVPKSCTLLIDEFYDSMLDNSLHLANNDNGFNKTSIDDSGRLGFQSLKRSGYLPRPDRVPDKNQIPFVSLSEESLCDRGGRDLCTNSRSLKPPHGRVPLPPLSQGGGHLP